MKTEKEQVLLDDINEILAAPMSITKREQEILIAGKQDLVKKKYLPRITNDLRNALTPLAIKDHMSKGVQTLYLNLIGSKYMDKGLGRGLMMTFGINHP